MFTISPQFLGDSKSPNPQKLKEIIHADIGSLIFDQPLDVAIGHLQALLNRNSRTSMTLRLLQSSPSWELGKTHLEGVRLETDSEVEERLELQRGYIRANAARKRGEIRQLKTKIKSLQKEAEKEEQKLKENFKE